MKAIWNGRVIVQSDATIVVEGNHYFPPDSVDSSLLKRSDTTTAKPAYMPSLAIPQAKRLKRVFNIDKVN